MDVNPTLGQRIKFLRNRMGITQNQLAVLSGLHLVSIKKYETNKTRPHLPALQQLAAAFGISIKDLIAEDIYYADIVKYL